MRTNIETRAARQDIYSNDVLSEIFRHTVSSPLWEPTFIDEMREFAELAASLAERKTIHVLDIGGGDGVASSRVLERLLARIEGRDLKLEIDLFETEECNRMYRRLIHERFVERANIRFRGLFDRDSEIGRYDLIIALHSLNAITHVTGSYTEFQDGIVALKRKLMAALSEGGKVIGSLGSVFGDSATFKRSCMAEVLNEPFLDITFEELVELWKPSTQWVMNGYFRFSSTGDVDAAGNHDLLVGWIRYFARIGAAWLSRDLEEKLVRHLRDIMIDQAAIPGPIRERLRGLGLLADEGARFLQERTGVFMVGRDPGQDMSERDLDVNAQVTTSRQASLEESAPVRR